MSIIPDRPAAAPAASPESAVSPEGRLQRPLSVSELNRQVRNLLEVSFMTLWVQGEISNLSRPSSGHWYFTLKDDKAQVRCAMFRNRNLFVKTPPRDGDQVTLRAKVSLYEGRGDYQLIVEDMEAAGEGALRRAFEALKLKLAAEGLFDETHKKPIPSLPRHIGVVTSPTGAAIHDILTVLKRRFPAIPVTLFPVAVQGAEAAGEIRRAIETANRVSDCDVLIVGRGGGSLEDLWPFNEEIVARAIFASRIPIVSAVGHEVDVTIADFVADLRAPTPSAAAEKISPDREELRRRLGQYEIRLFSQIRNQLRQHQQRLEGLAKRLKHPGHRLQEQAQRLDELELRLRQAQKRLLEQRRQRLESLHLRLRGRSPLNLIRLSEQRTANLRERLQRAVLQQLQLREQRLAQAAHTLQAVSPLATLSRGYSILLTQDQRAVRRYDEVREGDLIEARLKEGRLYCKVESRQPG